MPDVVSVGWDGTRKSGAGDQCRALRFQWRSFSFLLSDGVVPLQPAFLLQPHLYLGDALFAGMKRSRTRVHRVVSKGEFIRMAYCRAENEFGVGFGMEVDRLIRCLEGHQLARLDRLRNSKPS